MRIYTVINNNNQKGCLNRNKMNVKVEYDGGYFTTYPTIDCKGDIRTDEGVYFTVRQKEQIRRLFEKARVFNLKQQKNPRVWCYFSQFQGKSIMKYKRS